MNVDIQNLQQVCWTLGFKQVRAGHSSSLTCPDAAVHGTGSIEAGVDPLEAGWTHAPMFCFNAAAVSLAVILMRAKIQDCTVPFCSFEY